MQPNELVQRAHLAAVRAREAAYAPYSHYRVGAAALDATGEIISGCNIENASFGGTICAERVALTKAVSEGRRGFTDIVVVTDAAEPATPCGLCLQTMAEFCEPSARIWIADPKAIRYMKTFRELLPISFGPKQMAPQSR